LTFRRLAQLLRTGPGAIYHHVAKRTSFSPEDTVRMIALAVFDAIDAHPWVGAQLANPRQPAMLRIFESIGRAVHALGVPDAAGFTSASALTNYIVATGGLEWANLDRDEFPFTRNVAEQMRDHDDRAQFLDGIDLILTGIRMLGRPPPN
jgi:hypothetical protein